MLVQSKQSCNAFNYSKQLNLGLATLLCKEIIEENIIVFTQSVQCPGTKTGRRIHCRLAALSCKKTSIAKYETLKLPSQKHNF